MKKNLIVTRLVPPPPPLSAPDEVVAHYYNTYTWDELESAGYLQELTDEEELEQPNLIAKCVKNLPKTSKQTGLSLNAFEFSVAARGLLRYH